MESILAVMKNPAVLIGGTAAFGGVIFGAWNNIKVYFSYLWGMAFVKVNIEGHELSCAFRRMLRDEFKQVSFVQKTVRGNQDYIRSQKRNRLIGWIIQGQSKSIWRKGWRFIAIDNGRQNNESNVLMSISFLRGTFKFDKLVCQALDNHNKKNDNRDWKNGDRFQIIKRGGYIGAPASPSDRGRPTRQEPPDVTGSKDEELYNTATPLQWKLEDIGQPKKASAFGDLYFRDNVKEVIKEAFLWRDSEDWFKSRGLPWKRGLLIHSAPGCGKSSFVRALAQELNMPIVVFDLSTMSNNDFNDAWDTAIDRAPCIALFEDIDAVFDGRKNVAATGDQQGLSFDFFLNVIDGVQNSDGVFKVITTNNIGKIDPALGNSSNGEEMSTRPGRIDRVVFFDSLGVEGKEKMANRILGDFPREKWEHLLEKSEVDTGAQFQERCCRLALQLFWQEKQKELA